MSRSAFGDAWRRQWIVRLLWRRSSPVLRAGGIAVCGGPCGKFIAVLAVTMSATPLPIRENAGKSIAHHHPLPPGLKKIARATARKPTPMMSCVIPLARFGSLSSSLSCLFLCLPRFRVSRLSGNWPVIACGTSERFAPQERQNFTSSAFAVAHFGQYIIFSPRLVSTKHKLLLKEIPTRRNPLRELGRKHVYLFD